MQTVMELERNFEELSLETNLQNLHKLFKSVCKHLGIDDTKPQQSLFNQSNSHETKEYISSIFLRLLEPCNDLIWDDQGLRHKVIELLDDVYAPKVHKIINLERKEPTHEKYAKYREIESIALKNIEKINSSIVSIETAVSVKNNYIKTLKSPLSKIFTENQIYNKSLISVERISEFFNAVEQYYNAERINKLPSYQRLNEIYNVYTDDFTVNLENRYSQLFIETILNKVWLLAKSEFDSSELQSKSDISVIESKRKYPLHIEGREFQIKGTLVNNGPGIAYGTTLNIIDFDSPLSVSPEESNLGDLDKGTYSFSLKGSVKSPTSETPTILGQVTYYDHEKNEYEKEFEINLTPQNSDIDWDLIKYKQPYSLESIENEDELIGRTDLLETITEKLRLRKMESSIIYGQKRVGKTSLARTIQNRFQNQKDYINIFIETGSLDKSSPEMFIKSLGKKIIKNIKLKISNPAIKSIDHDDFSGSLHPLVSFVEDIMSVCNSTKIVIVLDEFDEIPSQLYPYTEAGDSFFHSLRSLSGASGEGRLSLMLVGGENMSVIMQTTDKLNKFDAHNVGYFDKSKSWKQFSSLVKEPVDGIMEYSDEAILSLYDVTEGNPFYTKFIAKNLYNEMADKHNSYISSDEMKKSISETMLSMEAINLNHFWSDCIRVEDQEGRDLIETHRRKMLIAFAEEKRNSGFVSKDALLKNKMIVDIPREDILESFINRNIMIYEDENIRIKPKLFENWLTEKGMHSLISSFSDDQALKNYQKQDEALYVSDSELSELVQKWDLYKGQRIEMAHVRAWLNQFQNNKEKKVAFKLLENISFYGEKVIREKLSVIHEAIRRKVVYSHKKSQKVRKDILISCFGTASKSGASILRMYASENKVTTHNIHNFDDIKRNIESNKEINAIVFIDDILATGNSIIEGIEKLKLQCGEIIHERGIVVVIGVICGMSDGYENILSQDFGFEIETVVCDIFPTECKVFSETSEIFREREERQYAQSICTKYGAQLQKMHPLGYQDSQLLVVFKDNCPNNSLPVLWSSSSRPKWIPLFNRS
ncbi:phosphoribosyltransferase-like protein [Vibrio fluvialis]|uniref:ATP-binding protein n=1 Tax=Vibrio fluvialis TaxID=676 RepID=UPI0013030EB3|nr:ATP-binding protein [Vibrio fluvialis]